MDRLALLNLQPATNLLNDIFIPFTVFGQAMMTPEQLRRPVSWFNFADEYRDLRFGDTDGIVWFAIAHSSSLPVFLLAMPSLNREQFGDAVQRKQFISKFTTGSDFTEMEALIANMETLSFVDTSVEMMNERRERNLLRHRQPTPPSRRKTITPVRRSAKKSTPSKTPVPLATCKSVRKTFKTIKSVRRSSQNSRRKSGCRNSTRKHVGRSSFRDSSRDGRVSRQRCWRRNERFPSSRFSTSSRDSQPRIIKPRHQNRGRQRYRHRGRSPSPKRNRQRYRSPSLSPSRRRRVRRYRSPSAKRSRKRDRSHDREPANRPPKSARTTYVARSDSESSGLVVKMTSFLGVGRQNDVIFLRWCCSGFR